MTILLPCGFFSFFYLSFFSSPNLSRRRLDVCHTSKDGVVLMRISDAGLKRAAGGSLKNTGRKKVDKNRHLGIVAQLCRAISSQLKHVSTIGKTYKAAICRSFRCPHNMVNFSSLAAEIGFQFGAVQPISTAFASWQRYCTAVNYSGRQPNFAALNKGPPMFGSVAITLGIDPHILVLYILVK